MFSPGKLRLGSSDVIYLFLRGTCDSPGCCVSCEIVYHPAHAVAEQPPRQHFTSRNPDYVSERRAGRLHVGSAMNPRPLEPAATCPQAQPLTPCAQVKCTGQHVRKSPPTATSSDSVPAGGVAGVGGTTQRYSASQPVPRDLLRHRGRGAWGASGRPGRL